MKENILKAKTFSFAVEIVNCYKHLAEKKKEFILSKQLLRSGTCVGAMIRECEYSESKADFIHKLAVAQKEINETIYWLELLLATEYITRDLFAGLHAAATKIIRLITSSIKTAKSSLHAKINHWN